MVTGASSVDSDSPKLVVSVASSVDSDEAAIRGAILRMHDSYNLTARRFSDDRVDLWSLKHAELLFGQCSNPVGPTEQMPLDGIDAGEFTRSLIQVGGTARLNVLVISRLIERIPDLKSYLIFANIVDNPVYYGAPLSHALLELGIGSTRRVSAHGFTPLLGMMMTYRDASQVDPELIEHYLSKMSWESINHVRAEENGSSDHMLSMFVTTVIKGSSGRLAFGRRAFEQPHSLVLGRDTIEHLTRCARLLFSHPSVDVFCVTRQDYATGAALTHLRAFHGRCCSPRITAVDYELVAAMKQKTDLRLALLLDTAGVSDLIKEMTTRRIFCDYAFSRFSWDPLVDAK